jgi:exodeoxyribonuclease-1
MLGEDSEKLFEANVDEEIQRRAQVVSQAKDFHVRVGEALRNRYPQKEPAAHVEERIYDGFPDRTDQFLMDQFHKLPWESREKIVDQFSDQRLRELGHRLIYLEKPAALSAAKRDALDLWKNQRLNSRDETPWLTVSAAISEAYKLLEEEPDNKIITELIGWLQSLMEIPDADLSQKSI